MITGQNLVYLGPENWAGIWRNRHWLMSIFSRENKVLYVEPERALRPTLAGWRRGQVDLTPWHWQPVSHLKQGLSIYHQPPFVPVTGLPGLRRASAVLRQRWLAGAARRLGLERPILWVSRPWVAHLAGSFRPRLTIYHVVDEYSSYLGRGPEQRSQLQRAEASVLRAADLVIVSSRALLEAKRPLNPQTFWVPNGVNLAGYAEHLSRGAPQPPELASVPRPRLGYLGQISSKLDFGLLEAMARARPDWSLVFVGALTGPAARADWEALRALPNVFDLGEVPAARVPEYTCGFDVGLMPYCRNEHSQNIDPLKLYDYLAAGLPIASVDLPALEGYRPLVRVGNTPAEFEAAVAAALREHSPAHVAERRRVAALNSWEQRAAAIADLIEPRLRGEPAPAAAPRRRLEPERAHESLT